MRITPTLRAFLGAAWNTIWTVLKALAGPFFLLLVWLAVAPWVPSAVAGHVRFAVNAWHRDPHLFVLSTGLLAIACLAAWSVLRSMYRLTVRPRGSGGEIARSASPSMAVVLSAAPVSDALAPTWRRIRDHWGLDYAEWVAARTKPSTSPQEMYEYAATWRKDWVRTSAWTEVAIARHEAAHAVVAHALGCTVTKVTIVPEGEARGHTSLQMAVPHPGDAEAAWTWMTIYLAGRAADHAHGVRHHGSSNDMEGVIRCATAIISTGQNPTGYHGPLTIDGLIAQGVHHASEMVQAHAEAIDALTDKLLTADTIRGYELYGFLCGVEPGSPVVAQPTLIAATTD